MSIVPRRQIATQAAIARALKGARDAGMTITQVEIDPSTGRIVLITGDGAAQPVTVLEAWRARRGSS